MSKRQRSTKGDKVEVKAKKPAAATTNVKFERKLQAIDNETFTETWDRQLQPLTGLVRLYSLDYTTAKKKMDEALIKREAAESRLAAATAEFIKARDAHTKHLQERMRKAEAADADATED